MYRKIKLTREEYLLARFFGIVRNTFNQKKHKKDSKISPESSETIDIRGMFGEVAGAKWLGLEPDFSIDPRKPHDDTPDLILPNGERIDCKTSKVRNPDLKTQPWKLQEKRVDWFMQFQWEKGDVVFYEGMARFEDLKAAPTKLYEWKTGSQRSHYLTHDQLTLYEWTEHGLQVCKNKP